MDSGDSLARLRAELAEKSQPRLAKCLPSRRTLGEERAAHAFRAALQACGLSQRAAARWLLVDERIVRDWLHGARALPAWAHHALPREGQIAYLQVAANDVPERDDADDDASSDEQGVA